MVKASYCRMQRVHILCAHIMHIFLSISPSLSDSTMNLLVSAARIVGVSCPSFTIGESPYSLTLEPTLARQKRRFCVVQPWRPVPRVPELRCFPMKCVQSCVCKRADINPPLFYILENEVSILFPTRLKESIRK